MAERGVGVFALTRGVFESFRGVLEVETEGEGAEEGRPGGAEIERGRGLGDRGVFLVEEEGGVEGVGGVVLRLLEGRWIFAPFGVVAVSLFFAFGVLGCFFSLSSFFPFSSFLLLLAFSFSLSFPFSFPFSLLLVLVETFFGVLGESASISLSGCFFDFAGEGDRCGVGLAVRGGIFMETVFSRVGGEEVRGEEMRKAEGVEEGKEERTRFGALLLEHRSKGEKLTGDMLIDESSFETYTEGRWYDMSCVMWKVL